MRFGKVVIPARMESERLPNKMMIEIMGRPMIEHVWRRACLVLPREDVVVATDSEKIASHMKSIGAIVYMSEFEHNNGSSRVSEYVNRFSLDFAVVLQGDEVLIRPGIIKSLYAEMLEGSADVINVTSPLTHVDELVQTDIVKCWVDSTNRIRFIFRGNPLRNPTDGYSSFKIINGLFAVSKGSLALISKTSAGLKNSESIEQMGALEEGKELFAFNVDSYMPSVNTYEELQKVISILQNDNEQKSILQSTF